jgi:hypothetical protein
MIRRTEGRIIRNEKRKTYSVYDKRGMVIVITHNAKIACQMLYTRTGQWIDWKKDKTHHKHTENVKASVSL